MADTTKKRKGKKTGSPKPKRYERRFAADSMQSSKGSALLGAAGALALGAGVYAKWIREQPLDYGTYLVAGGAIVLGAAMWFGDVSGTPVRVGDGGVVVERGSDVVRIMWCDVERIRKVGNNLVVTSEGTNLEIPINAHKLAIAWILKEAAERVPDVLDVKPSAVDGLPEPRDTDGERIVVKDLQIAGRRCRSSDKLITLERDARVCANCGEVYHHQHIPTRCETCESDLGKRALRI
ncbi:MAG: hypothetical protein R3B13_01610 [Polyangiaceae bacterium]